MIAFVVITSLLNLALGYALAVYFGRGSAIAMAHSPIPATNAATPGPVAAGEATSTDDNRRTDRRYADWSGDETARDESRSGEGTPASQEDASTKLLSGESDEPDDSLTAGPQIEENLMAGIEQFRNQLAKIKGEAASPKPETAAAAAAK